MYCQHFFSFYKLYILNLLRRVCYEIRIACAESCQYCNFDVVDGGSRTMWSDVKFDLEGVYMYTSSSLYTRSTLYTSSTLYTRSTLYTSISLYTRGYVEICGRAELVISCSTNQPRPRHPDVRTLQPPSLLSLSPSSSKLSNSALLLIIIITILQYHDVGFAYSHEEFLDALASLKTMLDIK